ncbi:gluconeogenesis factor YvcK family protein [Salsuginibacillus kocurii]|uniref:gluconeogenesis factor YvcK family protein n=1 Tax=Salsuginibacillus kocurii TaxID=427078 RepID=UPI00037AD2D3|nr:YvcK family protein [Salsuginibacillus kocurii]
MEQAKVVAIGGGTGLSVLLRGMKTLPIDISAIVTVADDGGSSGRLREELAIPPPGDVRNVLVALAEVEPMIEELFQHRFENGTGLNGHSLGNLLLAGMTSITGDFARGISEISAVLNVRGRVLPASNQSIHLQAVMEDGSIVKGESQIPKANKRIHRVRLQPNYVEPLAESIEAVQEADLIVIGPGSLYTSILPNLLVPGITDAIRASSAPTIYISNVMTQAGETDGYSVYDHVKGIHDHVGEGLIQKVLVDSSNIPAATLARYQSEGSEPVDCDRERLEQAGIHLIQDVFVQHFEGTLRHDAKKVAHSLLAQM